MSETITLNPVTRIEGHLSVKVEVEGGRVSRAQVTGEMFRGFEQILRGRSPEDAQHITQRICGVCPVEHGVASCLAQEMAFGVRPPDNGRLARNLIQAANILSSHVTHFYLLSGLDFVDIAAVTGYTGKDPGLRELQAWVKTQLDSKTVYPAAPFLPRYSGQYLPDGEANLTAIRHYLDALEIRAVGHKMAAVFAGKLPHAATLVAGGVTEQASALKIAQYREYLARMRTFIDHSYVPDVIAVAGAFPDYFALGRGCGNFLAFGALPESEGGAQFLPTGVLRGTALEELNLAAIKEDVARSWLSSPSGLAPADGQTTAAPDKENAYSWLKAPRYDGQPMEVGALARVLVAYQSGKHPAFKDAVDNLLKALSRPAADLVSVMGRHAARAIESQLLVRRCEVWLHQLVPDAPTCADSPAPQNAQGYGLTEAARGALGHWINVRDQRIANYQCVVPTTWNCSPRDDRDTPGPMEQALEGLPVADAQNPIEVARVVRAFDPCLACAVH